MDGKGWLRNSLKHRLSEALGNERKCRKAYRTSHGMVAAADALADCHAACAAVFRRVLDELDNESEDAAS